MKASAYFSALLVALAIASGALASGAAAAGGQARASVIGGSTATAGQWPSIAAIIHSNQSSARNGQFCGGTLVAPNWVLTAAHCVVGDYGSVSSPSSLDVAVGAVRLSAVTSGQRIRVSEVVPNARYKPSRYGNDVALLRLSRNSSQPTMAIIPPEDDSLVAPGNLARVAGWGCSRRPVGRPPDCPLWAYPNQLRQASIIIQSNSSCSALYRSSFDRADMICAGAGSPNACMGDSGGPLTIIGSAGVPVLAGNVSFGDEHCAGASDRGVYGRLSAFRSWAASVMGPETVARFGRPVAARLPGVLSEGVLEGFSCLRDCSARMTLTVSPETAARYGLGSALTVGSGRAYLRAGQRRTVTARFTDTAWARLRVARRLELTLLSTASSSGAAATGTAQTVVLER